MWGEIENGWQRNQTPRDWRVVGREDGLDCVRRTVQRFGGIGRVAKSERWRGVETAGGDSIARTARVKKHLKDQYRVWPYYV